MKHNTSTSFGVIGLGRFGSALAQSLAQSGKEVIVVDCKEEKVRELRQYTEYAYVAETLTKETLEEIGIQNCDTVIVCIGEKIDTSILTTLNVVSLGVPTSSQRPSAATRAPCWKKSAHTWCIRSATWHSASGNSSFHAIFSTTFPWTMRWKSSSSRCLRP